MSQERDVIHTAVATYNGGFDKIANSHPGQLDLCEFVALKQRNLIVARGYHDYYSPSAAPNEMGNDNWLTPVQANNQLKRIYARLYKCTWEPIDLSKNDYISYFNNPRKTEKKLQYDCYFSFARTTPLYDQRKLKENRHFLPDIRENIYQQELKKCVPVLTSLNYGKRSSYDDVENKYNHVGQIPSFYRRNGVFPVTEKLVSSDKFEKPRI